jgi:hypothetical protein
MEAAMNNRLLKLANKDLLELCDARGSTLQVARGAVWVTQQGDRSDVVLTAGDAWTIEQYGLTLVEARGDVEITLVGGAFVDARVRTQRVRWQDRLARWITRVGDRHLRRRWVPHV